MSEETKLFVRNLSYGVTQEILQDAFAVHGEVTFVRLCTDAETGRSRGFGFVSFSTKEASEKAIEALNGADLEGRTIEVKAADNKDSRPARGAATGGRDDKRQGRDFDRSAPRGPRGPCYSFQKGNCKFGDTCKFSHEASGDAGGEDRPRKQHREEYNRD
ncbi:hypothetical protein BASA82_000415 [Batrachochytrium salamandrivorans]|nr:hypothetical protein BASA81_003011 [Batrachochytrium salamandrivorans]KAH9262535.1 hypothetical protein BASA82_000415 [Batrachochytrium salamandrivorans]